MSKFLLAKVKIFFMGCLFSSALYALGPIDPVTPTLENEAYYFAIVNETGGYVDKALHQQFWQMMRTKYDSEQIAKIGEDINTLLDLMKAFQESTWVNAKQSYFAKNFEKTKDYEILKEKLLQQQTHYFSTQSIVENAEKIIAASANREPLNLGAGNFYITPELIEENLIGIKGSYERLALLLNPEWKEELKEYLLPQLNISLLALYATDDYHDVISQAQERIELDISQLRANKNAIYEIGSIDYQMGEKRFSHFMPQEKIIYLQEFIKEQFANYKVTEPLMSNGTWRNYVYTKGEAHFENFDVIIMSFFANGKAMYFKYLTNGNIGTSSTDFSDFIKRIQIIEKNK